MTKSISVKSLSILLALALLCSMGLMTLVLSSPSTAGAQPWSMYFVQTYVMEDEDEYDQVWVSIMNEDQTITDVQITNENDNENVEDPSVAIAPNGNIIVAWEHNDDDDDQIHYAVLDSSGAVVKGETALTSTAYSNYEPCVAVTPDGKVFVVWDPSDDGDDPVHYAILDTAGNILTTQTDITGDDDIDDPTVGTSTKDATNNNVVIAWEEDDGLGSNDNEVWFTVLNSSGRIVVASTQVTTNGVDSDDVNVAILPGGNFAIVWEETDGSDEQVWFTIRGSDGSIVKGNTKLTTSGEDSDDPGVAATPGGNIVIVWSEPVSGEDDNVFYTILDSRGNVVKAIAEVTTSSLDDDDCDVAIDQNGNIVITWEDWGGDTDKVSFAILTSGGTIVDTDNALTDGTYDISLDGEEGRRQVATKPTPLRPVGGEAFSPDRIAIMAPWVALAIAVAAGTGLLIRRRKITS